MNLEFTKTPIIQQAHICGIIRGEVVPQCPNAWEEGINRVESSSRKMFYGIVHSYEVFREIADA
jgi:hypothetical protein